MHNKTVTVSRTSVLTLRIMVSLIFLVAGANHLLQTEHAIERLDHARFGQLGHLFGPPEIPIILFGIIMMVFGILLMLGIQTRMAAIALALVLIPITVTVQVGQLSSLGPLFKNVAIMGGLLFFILNKKVK